MTIVSGEPSNADHRPYARVAVIAFVLAIVATTLAFIGAFWGPYWQPSPTASANDRWTVAGIWYIGPMILGLISIYLGSTALDSIERERAERCGEGLGVFAVMLGTLGFVTGTVSTIAGAFSGAF